jgi:hypothetical protein
VVFVLRFLCIDKLSHCHLWFKTTLWHSTSTNLRGLTVGFLAFLSFLFTWFAVFPSSLWALWFALGTLFLESGTTWFIFA